MQNGNVTRFRIVASGLIGLIAVGGGIFLLYNGIPVPDLFWYLAAGALAGVVGVDVLASIVNAIRK